MSTNKTVANAGSVTEFLKSVTDTGRRRDCKAVIRMLRDITGKRPVMWGPSIIGFGRYHYRYDSGREGDFFMAGVSPRARNLTVYLMPGCERYASLLAKLGKYKTGKSCLYIRSLDDVDQDILRKLLERSYTDMVERYDES